MTRTVESPRGRSTLTIESGDGIVTVRAATEFGTVTVPLRTNDLLAAVAAELGSVGLMYLALAEHYGAEPSVDEQQVTALAGLLDEDDHTVLGSGEALDTLARRLVARGVRVGGER